MKRKKKAGSKKTIPAALKVVSQNDHFLAEIVKSSGDAITITDKNGTIVFWNLGARELYGYSTKEMVGRPIFDIIPSEKREIAQETQDHVFAGKPIKNIVTQRTRRDGKILDLWVSIVPLRDDTGKIVAAARIARDITGLKISENGMSKFDDSLGKTIDFPF